MREETNKEIDLLLRRLSRRQGVPTSDAELRSNSDHLDADELSSYAENVVPAATRSRYTEHLAECSRCRELVVQLSASVPVVAAKETAVAAQPSGLRRFLASLFSPMVLRYAVPALVLIVAAAIGFVALRSRQGSPSVARLETQVEPAGIPNQQRPTTTLDKQAQIDPRSQSATPEGNAAKTRESVVPAPPPNAPPAVTSVRVEPKTDAQAKKAEEQAVANAAPAQPAPTSAQQAPKPAETVDEMRIEVEGRKAAPQSRATTGSEVARERNYEAPRSQDKKTSDLATTRPAKAKTGDSTAQGGGNFSVVDRLEKDRDDGLIRNVSGRRFRKQSGVWVDTAYDSGSATVNIARGSEQYRALIADEPAIKTIADQLDGSIIVVWKGRAYRIR